MDTGQHYSSHASLLLHWTIRIGPEARTEYTDAHVDDNTHCALLAHANPRDARAHGDATTNAHAVVSSDAYADARGHTDWYTERDADGDANTLYHANGDEHAVTDLHAVSHGNNHTDRRSDGHADQHTNEHADECADRDAFTDSRAQRHAGANGNADVHSDDPTDGHGHTDNCSHRHAAAYADRNADRQRCRDRNADSDAVKHSDALRTSQRRIDVEAIPLLKQLSEAEGMSGFESPIRDLVRQIWEPFVGEMYEGKLGSLIALKRGVGSGPRPKLMLAAHMDEIGLMVTGIEEGFLRITRVGGSDRRVLLGLEVTVHGRRDVPGVVATRPPHVLPKEEREKTVPFDKIFVDVGLRRGEVEDLVSVGDLISVRRELKPLKNRRVAGKALDDRACVAAITLALERLNRIEHSWDLFAVATAQEETGLKGAITSAYGVAPDLAIALDVTFGDQPGVDKTGTLPLGGGPSIALGPNFHPKLVERLKTVAEDREIPYQMDPIPGRSGTDAWAIQVTREGVPTALVSIPLRYMHQPVETLAVEDVERAGRLLAAFVADSEASLLDEMAWEVGE